MCVHLLNCVILFFFQKFRRHQRPFFALDDLHGNPTTDNVEHKNEDDTQSSTAAAEQPPRASPVATKLRLKIIDLTSDLHAAELSRFPLIPDIQIVKNIARIKTELIYTSKTLKTTLASTARSRKNRLRKRTEDILEGKDLPKLGRPSVADRLAAVNSKRFFWLSTVFRIIFGSSPGNFF